MYRLCERLQKTSIVQHLDHIVDDVKSLWWDVEPVVKCQRQFDSNLLSLDLQQVGKRLQ